MMDLYVTSVSVCSQVFLTFTRKALPLPGRRRPLFLSSTSKLHLVWEALQDQPSSQTVTQACDGHLWGVVVSHQPWADATFLSPALLEDMWGLSPFVVYLQSNANPKVSEFDQPPY